MEETRYIDYEKRALEAMEQGKVAEAQVWATMWRAQVARRFNREFADVRNALAEISVYTNSMNTEMERIRERIG